MNCEELPIYRDVWDMVRLMDKYIVNFPREYKYSHGAKLRELGIDLIKYLSLANACTADAARRAGRLEIALGLYEAYKFTKRLAFDAKCLSVDQSNRIDLLLAKVGRQLMGWKLNAEKKVGR